MFGKGRVCVALRGSLLRFADEDEVLIGVDEAKGTGDGNCGSGVDLMNISWTMQ